MKTEHQLSDGNTIIVDDTTPLKAIIYIRVKEKTNKVGILNRATGELIVYRKRNVHKHHRTDSYGFNHCLMRDSKHIKTIHIYEDNNGINNEYIIKRENLLTNGNVLNFIGEEQIFYPIPLMEIFNKI